MSFDHGSNVVNRIKDELLESAGTRVGKSLDEVLRIIPDAVFLRTTRFIMEFLQNAEDACMEINNENGVFKIHLNDHRIKIVHNGKPFDEKDLESLCAIGSSKKPEKGYIGYLGIGFKSVFKVSDKVYVISGPLRFKFDREYWIKLGKEKYGLWPITPIPIDPSEITETIENRNLTAFLIYFRGKGEQEWRNYYNEVRKELEGFTPHLFLFLKHIKKVEVYDEVENRSRRIEWFTRTERILENGTTVDEATFIDTKNGTSTVHRLLVFRRVFDVPIEVKMDEETKSAKRSEVIKREVAIAFYLDTNGNLIAPKEGRLASGFYSFLPLEEELTGIKFIVQADFVTQAGREAVRYEAMWNKWMMECIAEVAKDAIKYFWRNPKYCAQYLPIFEFEDLRTPFQEYLVKPILKKEIDKMLRDPYVPTPDGNTIKLSQAVKITEEITNLIKNGFLEEDDLEIIFNEKGLHFIGTDVKISREFLGKVKFLRLKEVNNKSLIEKKIHQSPEKGIQFVVEIYREASQRNVIFTESYVIDENMNIIHTHEAYFKTLPEDVKKFLKEYPEARDVLKDYKFVHPKLESELKDLLKNYGVKEISYIELCRKVLLPKISTDVHPPSREKLLAITTMLKQGNVKPYYSIWVVTKSGKILSSEEVFYPEEDTSVYEKIDMNVLDLNVYMELDSDKEGWYHFFLTTKMKGFYNKDYAYFAIHKILPVVKTSRNKDKLLLFSYALKKMQKRAKIESQPINILTTDGRIVNSNTAYLHSSYQPDENWVQWAEFKGFEIGPFVSDEYLKFDGDTEGWKLFFKRAQVREKADTETVKEFAETYAKHKLEEVGYTIVGGRGKGYDFLVMKGGKQYYVEVKGRKSVDDVELNENETEVALTIRENYMVVTVFNIPNKPEAYLVKDPAGKVAGKLKLRIPKNEILKGERL